MTAARLRIGIGLNALAHRLATDDIRAPGRDALERAVLAADAASLDFVTLDDRFGEDGDDAGRSPLDSVLFASVLALRTTRIGLIPATTVSFREPFHLSTSIATLDYVSAGRAGWQPGVPPPQRAVELAQHSGSVVYGLDYASRAALSADAADAVEVARRLWDSWEDDAIIRDVATGRFIDRSKLHYVDFEGASFRVRGPSIVPRSPQGQPVVAIRADDDATLAWAAAQADVVFFDATALDDARAWLDRLRTASDKAGREPPRAYADFVIAFGESAARLPDALPAPLFRGEPAELAARLAALAQHGVEGVRLHPFDLERDLATLVADVLPVLREAGHFRPDDDEPATLRARLGLLHAAPNRYASASGDTEARRHA